MSNKRHFRKGVGTLTLGSLLLSGAVVLGADAQPPLTRQLSDLGRQALAQGDAQQARNFFRKALELDPSNVDAKRGLESSATVRRAAFQEPVGAPVIEAPVAGPDGAGAPVVPPAPGIVVGEPVPGGVSAAPAAPAEDARATLEASSRDEELARQRLTSDIRERLQNARNEVNTGRPESALVTLRSAKNAVETADGVDEATKKTLRREIEAQMLSTTRAEERIVAERAQALQLQAAAEQQSRNVDKLIENQQTVAAMMVQFDSLMRQGLFNVRYWGGAGDLTTNTAPFFDARLLAQHATALIRDNSTPKAGVFVSQATGFLAQELALEQLKEYRFMISMQDVTRANIMANDAMIIEYPAAERWRELSERRIKRYGNAVDLLDRDPKTKSILAKLDEPISMSFANETPLEDVLKYIKSATQGPNDNGIPIYVDPIGLQEAEKTLTSTITLDLEGVPLKKTLRLMLKQLGLTYTVKDGLLTITSETSEDQPTEIRVYPVADLAIIPLSLMMGGGGGGMGGGMGGMGGGMMGGMGGGMGGGMMGGMGGGMGGGMMGGMGGMGMMSIPARPAAH